VNFGDKSGENAVSIEPLDGGGKPFSQGRTAGLYSSAHDEKMTENGDCGLCTGKITWRAGRG
jgi:hypothetical protein